MLKYNDIPNWILKLNLDELEFIRKIIVNSGSLKELAKEYGMSPAYIATNKLLIYLSTYLPKNREEYLKIRFTGERSYEKYGVHFVEIIKQYLNKK